jgi:multiple sugar transport system ATP-binding protein
MAELRLRAVTKRFGALEVVKPLDLDVAHQEFLVLVGPSGCGKSTLLRMIAGLEEVTAGEIEIDHQVVNEVAPKDRDIAMVFQDYALYPHLTVFENMAFGLAIQKRPAAEIRSRVDEAAAILNIGHLLARKPRELSGGQRQRVAMGRAIVRKPRVFLFDEPLSNLDAQLRVQMRTEIKKLHAKVATTVIYVTHDQVEAMTLAHRIVVLRDGVIEQVGTPDEVYNSPATMFVAGFIGAPTMNFLRGRLAADASRVTLGDGATLTLGERQRAACRDRAGGEIVLGVRPEHFSPAGGAAADLAAAVEVIEPLGSDTLVFFSVAGAEAVARVPPRVKVRPGDTLPLALETGQLSLFDPQTQRALRA